jgi:hypothetical protein
MGIDLVERIEQVTVWQGMKDPEAYMRIAQALSTGAPPEAVAKQFGRTVRTIKRIADRISKLRLHEITISDGVHSVRVGTIAARGASRLPPSLPIVTTPDFSSRLN